MIENRFIPSKVKGKALVLLSGGLDSTTCAALAVLSHGKENVFALSLYYGQKHKIELECAKRVSNFLDIKHEVLQLPPIFGGAGSTLVEGGPKNPERSYQQISDEGGISPTYVPFRNGNLLSAATALALAKECDYIYYGAHAEDARNWAYPDCTPEFNGAMANAIYIGSYHRVRLVTPLQYMEKHEVVRRALEIFAPLNLTYSCYNGGDRHCGKCPTCIGRIHAFARNGVKDRVPYVINIAWEELWRRYGIEVPYT